MPFVLDASVAASWALASEDHPIADLAASRIRSEDALAPGLLWFELRNILVAGERRKRIAEHDTHRFLRTFDQMRIIIDRFPREDAVLGLARSHRLSFYDASYLELAHRERLPLATLDKNLARAAQVEGVEILGD